MSYDRHGRAGGGGGGGGGGVSASPSIVGGAQSPFEYIKGNDGRTVTPEFLIGAMVEQDEAGEDGGQSGHEASKIQAPASVGSDRRVTSVASSSRKDGSQLGTKVMPIDARISEKTSSGNASKPPAVKRRRKSALHVQFAKSPLLKRILVSPRTQHCRAKRQRSPSMIRGGPSSSSILAAKGGAASSTSWSTPNDDNQDSSFSWHKSMDDTAMEQAFNPDEQISGSQDGGQFNPTLLPPEQIESQLPVRTLPGEHVDPEVGNSTASRSLGVLKSMLSKRRKRRKSPGSHVQIMRSPQLKRIMLSPRGHYAAKQLKSSSVRGTLLASDEFYRSPSIMSSSSASPDDTTMDTSHSPVPDASRKTRRRKLRSKIWKEFEPIYDGNLVVQAKCTHCLDIFPANRETGRSTCRRHLETCKERIRMTTMVENLTSMSPDAITLKNWKFDQEVSRKAMVEFIVLQELPFSLVDHAPFRRFIATLNPLFRIVSRTTVTEDVVRSYEETKTTLREIIKNTNSKICLTADMWTSIQNIGYLCVTCHFIDNDWKLQKRIISFVLVASPHDGYTMFGSLLKSLQDWKLEHRLFSITLDNAKNNNKMAGYLRKNLLDRKLVDANGDLLHMRCAAHVLNLIVQEGFKILNSAINRIRDSVRYIRSSQARKERFEEIIVQAGISCEKHPPLDVPTRWNSTYLMLKAAVEYRTAFETLDSQDLSYLDNPLAPEWELAYKLLDILKIFYDGTNEVSGTLYPTANLYFHVLWKVKERLEKEASNKDSSIAAMAVKMKAKFQKYWDLCLLQICVPIVLDPRFKFSFLAFRLNAGFGDKGLVYAETVKTTIKDLFSAYSPMLHDENNSQSRQTDEVVGEEDEWADWEHHLTQQKRKKVENELDVYYQDDLFPRQKSFDVLQWWMMHSTKYPILSRMARDVFAAPASTVASEAAFSTTGRVVSEYRSRLTCKNVEALVCLQDWLRAEGHADFKIPDDTGDGDDTTWFS